MEYSVVFTKEQIEKKVAELACQIAIDYKGKKLVAICVLNGGFIFFSDLSKALWDAGLTDFEVDFVRISSYGAGTTSSEHPTLTKDIEVKIEGREVLIVDEIIETGRTPHFLTEHLAIQKPTSIKLCTLLSKPLRKVDIEPDYLGFEVDVDDWVEGYGMDTDSLGRGRGDIIKKP